MKHNLILISLAIGLLATSLAAQKPGSTLLIPIGGGYSEIYAGFSQAVIERASGQQARILVLPIALATNPTSISDTERDEELDAAEERRQQIEVACQNAAPPGMTCTATLAPVFTRSDAENLDYPHYFQEDLTAIFILGGDQTIAMQVIGGTLFEKELERVYQRGVLIAGTSAGAGLQSATMIGGYQPGYDNNNSLNFGAADVWIPPARHGFLFGAQDIIIEQHFFDRNLMGRLLNAITLPGVPHIGVGLDSDTGVFLSENARLERVFGRYTVTVLDAETYHAADAVQYGGARFTLSLRNVLVHMLAPGNFSYDIQNRRHSLAIAADRIERSFEALTLPPGAGSLFLSGDMSEALLGNPAITHFINASGGEQANILIVAAGFSSAGSAQVQADKFKTALGVPTQIMILPEGSAQPPSPIPLEFTGVVLIAKDQSLLNPQLLLPIRDAWQRGVSLLTDDAASAVIGAFYSAQASTPDSEQLAEAFTQQTFISGNTPLKPGLGLLNIAIESQIMSNNRWGRLFSLAYNHPNLLAIGLNNNTVLSITPQGAVTEGENATIVLDLRYARLALGDNQGFVIANGLMDIFAPGESLRPAVADTSAAPVPAATPYLELLKTPTLAAGLAGPQATPTGPSSKETPTKTPRLMPTPFESPPPADSNLLHGMILLGIIAVVVVLLGIWINRERDNLR